MKDQNAFLYAISSLGFLDSTDYQREFSNLCLDSGFTDDISIEWEREKFVRILLSLGHIELNNKKRIFVCPPQLTLIRKDINHLSVLTGARTPYLLEKLIEYIEYRPELLELVIVEQKHPLARNGAHLLIPDAIFIKSKNVNELRELAKTVQIDYQLEKPNSENLFDFSKSVTDYRNSLMWDKRTTDDPIKSKIKVFSTNYLRFIERSSETTENQQLALYYFPPFYEYWLWECGRGAKVKKDWGRYLLLNLIQKRVLIYNKDSEWLAVPSTLPLPKVLSRSLTLCSGLAPLEVYSEDLSNYGLPYGIPFSVYFLVTLSVAEKIAQRLGQELIINEISPHPDLCNLMI